MRSEKIPNPFGGDLWSDVDGSRPRQTAKRITKAQAERMGLPEDAEELMQNVAEEERNHRNEPVGR